jgi:hypothetical protein
VTGADGAGLPGVTVEVRSTVLAQPRIAVTSADGTYRVADKFFASGALRFELGPRSRLDVRGEYLHCEGDFDRGLGNNARPF